mmetsp:Transcript_29940/g.96077  ORF Transcript_29940/g.96077 Transcript_29940/m.96077 type:complete len:404 (+) Transcript_29940:259-1470(+)
MGKVDLSNLASFFASGASVAEPDASKRVTVDVMWGQLGRPHAMLKIELEENDHTVAGFKRELEKVTGVAVEDQAFVNGWLRLALDETPIKASMEMVQLIGDPPSGFKAASAGGGLKGEVGAPAQSVPPAERAEAWRQKGNDAFKFGRFTEAIDYYDRAIKCVPGNARALGNRSAAFMALRKYESALSDADLAIAADDTWSKAHGRRASALFELKRYGESADAYGKALSLDPENADYKDGKHKASYEASKRRERASASAASAPRPCAPAVKRTVESEEGRYARELEVYEKKRSEALVRWRASSGQGEEVVPDEDRGMSTCVDILGRLRGRCTVEGVDCPRWVRDLTKMKNWSDLNMTKCEICGHEDSKHESCGDWVFDPPPKPLRKGGIRSELSSIPGVQSFAP